MPAPLSSLKAPLPDELFELDPLICMARAWKALNVLEPDSTALTEKTMPEPQ